jgi:hypothetical protein
MSLALTDARNDVRLADHTDHLVLAVADDDKVSPVLTEERSGLSKLCGLAYPRETGTGDWQHGFDVHR